MKTLCALAIVVFMSISPGAQNSDSSKRSAKGPTTSTSAPENETPCSDDVDSPKIDNEKEISPGLLLQKVAPKYPRAARKAHIQGTVVMCAVIGKDGTIRSLRAISGPQELIPAALEAVHKWRYRPYLYRNEPVEVNTDIRVNFTLQ